MRNTVLAGPRVWIVFAIWSAASACVAQSPAPRPQVVHDAASLNPEKPEAASPFEPAFKDMLPKLQAYEAEPDRLKRCLNFPDPPNTHWDREVVVALCEKNFRKYVYMSEFEKLLQDGNAAKLDAMFSQFQKDQRSGKIPDIMDLEFSGFGNAKPYVRNMADTWMKASPHSAFALTASGLQYQAAAEDARGYKFYAQTPRENIAKMIVLDAKADEDLKKALAIDPKMITAIVAEANVSMFVGSREDALGWIRRGMAMEPSNFDLHNTNGLLATLRWGGSEEEQKQAAALAMRHVKQNPRLAVEAVKIIHDLMTCDCENNDKPTMHDYERMLINAPELLTLRDAGYVAAEGNNWPMTVGYMSQLFRFSYGTEPDAHTRRGIAYAFLGDFDAANRDAEAALAVLPNDHDALQLKQWMIPAFKAEAEAIKADQQREAAKQGGKVPATP